MSSIQDLIEKLVEVYLKATPATPKSGPKTAKYKIASIIFMPMVTALVFLNIIGYNGGLNKSNATIMLIIFYLISMVIHIVFDFWRFKRFKSKYFSES